MLRCEPPHVNLTALLLNPPPTTTLIPPHHSHKAQNHLPHSVQALLRSQDPTPNHNTAKPGPVPQPLKNTLIDPPPTSTSIRHSIHARGTINPTKPNPIERKIAPRNTLLASATNSQTTQTSPRPPDETESAARRGDRAVADVEDVVRLISSDQRHGMGHGEGKMSGKVHRPKRALTEGRGGEESTRV